MKTASASTLRLVPLAALVIALGGCSLIDPYEKPGQWRPMGANAMNLELQVAHPSDLAQGRGTTEADGDTAAQAVDRALHDKAKALMSVDTLSSGSGS